MMERHFAGNSPYARPLWLHQFDCRYGRAWRKGFPPRFAILRQTVLRVRRAKQGDSHTREQAPAQVARADYSRRVLAQTPHAPNRFPAWPEA